MGRRKEKKKRKKKKRKKKKRRKKRKNRRVVDWSKLEKDALELIATRLTILDDFIRFGAVCKTWRSIFLENRHLPRHQFPVLMIPDMDDKNNEFRSFFSFSRKQIYRLEKLPNEGKKRCCCGSSEGYLIMEEYPNHSVFLLNPFSRTETSLPCLTTISKVMDVHETDTGTIECTCRFPIPDHHTLIEIARYSGQYVYKAITAGPYVLAILSSQTVLAFCKLDGDGWTYMDGQFIWWDIVWYNGNFYLINHRGRVVVLDMSGPHPTLTVIVELVDVAHYYDKYLVESSGQLLMVARDFYPETMYFEIFRVDVDKHLFFPLKSLGDGILFLGDNSLVSLSARDFSRCDGNRIYFVDYDSWNEHKSICVYNVEDGSFRYYCEMDWTLPSPIWLTPKLW